MPEGKTDRDNGIVIGIVDNLDDPERLGRVQVKFPHLNGVASDWAWIVSPMAGDKRGLFMRPEVGDQVLVAFVHGDPQFPYILGSLWSKSTPPPPDDGKPVDNNWRWMTSRSGHVVKMDDTQGAEKIEIIDQTGGLKITLDSSSNKITVNNDKGDVQVTSGAGAIGVSASAGKITVAGLNVEVSGTASLKLTSDGTVTIQGALVQIN